MEKPERIEGLSLVIALNSKVHESRQGGGKEWLMQKSAEKVKEWWVVNIPFTSSDEADDYSLIEKWVVLKRTIFRLKQKIREKQLLVVKHGRKGELGQIKYYYNF